MPLTIESYTQKVNRLLPTSFITGVRGSYTLHICWMGEEVLERLESRWKVDLEQVGRLMVELARKVVEAHSGQANT
jgi:hypothetical protein